MGIRHPVYFEKGAWVRQKCPLGIDCRESGINAASEAFWSTEAQDNSSLFCFFTALDAAVFNVC